MSATGSRTGVEHLSLNLDVALLENEVLAAEDPLPDVVHVVNDSLEVGGRVVRACDEDVIRLARGRRGVQRGDRDELLVDGAEEREARLDLLLGPVGFDDGGNNRDVDVLCADIVRGRDHGNVDIVTAADLVLGDDDLRRVRVVRAGDRVLEEADRANNLALFDDADLAALLSLACTEVTGVTNNLLGLDSLVAGANADELAVSVGDDLVNGLVKHVGTAVNGTQTSEGLGKLAETIEGVDVWGLAIASH